jgi:hypothetical protein
LDKTRARLTLDIGFTVSKRKQVDIGASPAKQERGEQFGAHFEIF